MGDFLCKNFIKIYMTIMGAVALVVIKCALQYNGVHINNFLFFILAPFPIMVLASIFDGLNE